MRDDKQTCLKRYLYHLVGTAFLITGCFYDVLVTPAPVKTYTVTQGENLTIDVPRWTLFGKTSVTTYRFDKATEKDGETLLHLTRLGRSVYDVTFPVEDQDILPLSGVHHDVRIVSVSQQTMRYQLEDTTSWSDRFAFGTRNH